MNFQNQKDDRKEKRQVSINPKVFFALCVLSKKFLKYMFARIGRTRSPTGYTRCCWLQEKGEVELEDSELKGRHSNRSGPL